MDIRLFLLQALLSSMLFQFTYANTNKIDQEKEHSVLVLHSYHQGLEWTDNITNGILSVLKKRTEINLVFEYLDTKRNYNEEYFSALYDLYQVKAKQIPFDAIIVSDNAAYNFLKEYSDEFYPNIPVVFCGINNLDTIDLKQYKNFFGIGERADHYGTIASIKKIFPERNKVLIINDNTITGQAIRS
ncbi:MAG: hypothetical protein MI922_21745, partial [Bacteroidales bacterium]|nr:hypothetical protein [Bacteroidales bacterium]